MEKMIDDLRSIININSVCEKTCPALILLEKVYTWP